MSYVISKITKINDSTSSSSKTTGAFTVKGGISSEENIHSGGYIGITGSVNTVNIKVQSATNSFNFNLPTSSGTAGQILTSGGGLSKPMSWSSTTGSGYVVLNSGPVFGIGGITSTAGPTILGETTVKNIKGISGTFSSYVSVSGMITSTGGISVDGPIKLGNSTIGDIMGTTANFSKNLNVTGIATFSGGLKSITGMTMLGSSTIGPITGTSATFSAGISASGMAKFPGGLSAGTTKLGISTIGPITGDSATFSSTLNVRGLSTLTGGLVCTNGNTTLGNTTTQDISASNASFTKDIKVEGNATFLGGIVNITKHTTLGATSIGIINGSSAIFNSSDSSYSDTTGALKVKGGISTQENLHVGGCIGLNGSISGIISIKTQSSSGTYNFNLPTSSGSPGQVLTSQGGGTNAMSWTFIKKSQSGLTSTDGKGSVVFPEPFTSPPIVVASGSHPLGVLNIEILDVTKTGFSFIRRYQSFNGGEWKTLSSSPPSYWHAMLC